MRLLSQLMACWGSTDRQPSTGTSKPAEKISKYQLAHSNSSNECIETAAGEAGATEPSDADHTGTSAAPAPTPRETVASQHHQQQQHHHQQQQQQQQQRSAAANSALAKELSLCADLMQGSLQHMTAISLCGTSVYQNDHSLSYFGDLSLHPLLGKEGLPLQLLQELFRIEGKQVLGQAIETVMEGEPGNVWHRVIRAPADCLVASGAAEAQNGLNGREQGRRGSMAMSRRSLALSMGGGELCKSKSGSSIGGKDGSEALATPAAMMQSAAEMSVAMRHAPQMVKSLLELSMANNTGASSKSRFQEPTQVLSSGENLSSMGGVSKHVGSGGRAQSSRAWSKLRVRRSVTLPTVDVVLGSLAGKGEGQQQQEKQQQEEVTEQRQPETRPGIGAVRDVPNSRGWSHDPIAEPRECLDGGEAGSGLPRVPPEVPTISASNYPSSSYCFSSLNPSVSRPPVMSYSPSGGAESSGTTSTANGRRAPAVPGGDSQTGPGDRLRRCSSSCSSTHHHSSQNHAFLAMLLDSLPSVEGRRKGRRSATGVRASVTRRRAAPTQVMPIQLELLGDQSGPVEGYGPSRLPPIDARETVGSCDASKSVGEGEGQQQEECMWHEVRIMRINASYNSEPILLIYQTDVSVRTQLEMTMAGLTQAQLTTLTQIFPRHVVEYLSVGAGTIQPASLGQLARTHQDISILFMDIVGFTTMSKQVPASAVMTFLNGLFSVFDDLCVIHGVHKVETAGDCYIVSSGLVAQDGEGFFQVEEQHDPVESAAKLFQFARDMLACSREVMMPHDGTPVNIRIGIHTGPCTSGVVGSKLPKFGLFGDTMNTASRMESTCSPGRVQLSAATHAFLMRSGISDPEEWQPTGGIEVKGKGVMETFLWLEPPDVSVCDSHTYASTVERMSQPWAHSSSQQPDLVGSFSVLSPRDSGAAGQPRQSQRRLQRVLTLGNMQSASLMDSTMQLLNTSDRSTKNDSGRLAQPPHSNDLRQPGEPRPRPSISAALPDLAALLPHCISSEGRTRLPSSSQGQLPAVAMHHVGSAAHRLQALCDQAGRSEAGHRLRRPVSGLMQQRFGGAARPPAFVSQFQALGQLAGMMSQSGKLSRSRYASSSQVSLHLGSPLGGAGGSGGSGGPRPPNGALLRASKPSSMAIIRTGSGPSDGQGSPGAGTSSALAGLQGPAELSTRILHLLWAGPDARKSATLPAPMLR